MHFNFLMRLSSFRELTSNMCWSAWPDTACRRCRTPSNPNILPVDTERCLRSLTDLIQKDHLHFLGELTLTTCSFRPSGGDTSGVEQARHRKLGSSVDHHLGHPGWFTASGSTHLRPIQGQWIKVYKLLFWRDTENLNLTESRLVSVLIFNSRFSNYVFCSSASSNDLYLTAPPWRKHNSSHRLPLRPRRAPELPEPQSSAVWLQQILEWIRKRDHWNSTVLH